MKKILLVDDDPMIRDLVKEILHEYDVTFARDGWEAVKQIDSGTFDLYILDISLPMFNGMQLCDRIKRDPSIRHRPVMMLTGNGLMESVEEGFQRAADEYMVKPFLPRQLEARVRNLIAAGEVARA